MKKKCEKKKRERKKQHVNFCIFPNKKQFKQAHSHKKKTRKFFKRRWRELVNVLSTYQLMYDR